MSEMSSLLSPSVASTRKGNYPVRFKNRLGRNSHIESMYNSPAGKPKFTASLEENKE
jgi:hypothetical protein